MLSNEEKWLPLAFCKGKYEVSNTGKVKSIYTVSKMGEVRYTGTILKPAINYRCYKKVAISWIVNGIWTKKTMAVHRLVAICWLPNPENLPQVNHMDLNQLNNFVTNLEWCTAKHNTNHAQQNGRMPIAKPRIKKGWSQGFKKIVNIETNEVFAHAKELSKLIDYSPQEIRRRLNGERYNNTPYRYLGEESLCKVKPIKEYTPELVGKFNDGVLIDTIDRKKIATSMLNKKIGSFLSGRISNVDGFTYKKLSSSGEFIEPPKFIPKPKPIKQTVPAAKPLVKLTLEGIELRRYKSVKEAAEEFGVNKRSFRKMIVSSPRNYYKGFIFKYI